MSYKNYLKGLTLVENNKDLISRESVGKGFPQTKNLIENAEKMLNVYFPKSYKDFLTRFGKITFGGECVYGLDDREKYEEYRYSNSVCNTLEERNVNLEPSFPVSFIVIYDLGNGEKYCLDTAQMNNEGECPVVGWYFGRIEKIHEDFGEFFLETIKVALEFLEQNGHTVNWN